MRRFDVVATRDPETGYWWGGNDELPLTTEGHTFDEFSERATAIGQEMAEVNGLVAPGERAEIRIVLADGEDLRSRA